MDLTKLKNQLNEFESLLHEETNGDNCKQMMIEGNLPAGDLQLIIYVNGERHKETFPLAHMGAAVRKFNEIKY